MRSARLELDIPDAGNPVPHQVLWVCLLAPLGTTFLMRPDLLTLTAPEIAREVGAMLVPFASIPGTLFLIYRYLLPPLLRRLRTPSSRWTLHVAMATVVTAGLSLIVLPVHNAVCGLTTPPGQFAMISVVFSVAFLLPSIALKQLAVRARNVERMAHAERQSALEAQLQALQARTNPHFFFNSINTVASLIPDDPKLAERTLERLADLFRYALDSSKVKAVTLRREVEVVRDYLAIAQARFGDRLVTSVELDEGAADVLVPPLLLQPLVENAIVHGASSRSAGRVRVSVKREGNRVCIEVGDDGPGPGASEHEGTQTSVSELKQRLRLLYGEGGTFELLAGPTGGCVARLGIPVA
jgi:two-component system sensor histidine kinase AlgZ